MALQPSRKDTFGPPPRNVSDLSALVRHHGSYLRSLDPGYLDGRFATPKPVPPGPAVESVGDDGGDGAASGTDIAFWNTDQAVTGEPGQISLPLTYEPIDGSLHIRWNGVDQPPTEWALDGQLVTFTDGLVRAGDILTAAYAYDNGEIPDPTDALVSFDASGWYWLQTVTSDPADYSSDTTFGSAGTAPFGETDPPHSGVYGDYNTVWNQGTMMWARRTVVADAGSPILVVIKWNRAVQFWWNGVHVYGNSGGTGYAEVTVDGSDVLASNLAVFKATDDQWTGPGTGCYFTASVSQVVE